MTSTIPGPAPARPPRMPAPLPAHPHAGDFIASTPGRLADGGAGLPLAIAAFDVDAYAPGLYAAHGIHQPPALLGRAVKRQAEYLAGRVCARTVLEALGHDGFTLLSGADRAPLWPAGVVGSITHSRRHAGAVAAASDAWRGVGIDIERVVPNERASAVAGAIMTRAEAVRLGAAPGTAAFARLVTLVFSAKESFYKAAYAEVGAWFGFDAVELVRIDLVQATLGFRCTRALAPSLDAGMAFTAGFRMLDPATVLTSVLLARDASRQSV